MPTTKPQKVDVEVLVELSGISEDARITLQLARRSLMLDRLSEDGVLSRSAPTTCEGAVAMFTIPVVFIM